MQTTTGEPMNKQLEQMVRERDANKRARLAAVVQADIIALAGANERLRLIVQAVIDAGIETVVVGDLPLSAAHLKDEAADGV